MGRGGTVYVSFLIRMWRAITLREGMGPWQCEVEHIQSGRRWRFGSLEELIAFLRNVEALADEEGEV